MKPEICKLCNIAFSKISGHFTIHLQHDHNLSLEEYVVLTEFNGVHPKCQCGYCDIDSTFNHRNRTFLTINFEHRKFAWLTEQKLKAGESGLCLTCGMPVKWVRGKPNSYCSFKCMPNKWNQSKINETVNARYSVDNVYQIPEVIEKIQKSIAPLRKNNTIKSIATKKIKYKNGAFDSDKMKSSMLKNHGVEHPSQILKNRENSSLRMISQNARPIKTYQYDTNLYFQSTYEKHFLDLCNRLMILDKIKNGNSYKYLEVDKNYGHRLITDFSIENIEIEIKSTYVLNRQGGPSIMEAKRRAVEFTGKKYLIILDKNYTEFLEFIFLIVKKC